MTMHEFSNRVRNYPQGTAWMSFYIYIRFPLGLVWDASAFSLLPPQCQTAANSELTPVCSRFVFLSI